MAMYQVQMVNNVKTLVPVSGDVSTDSVTDNDMHPVTSNAVAREVAKTITIPNGKIIAFPNGVKILNVRVDWTGDNGVSSVGSATVVYSLYRYYFPSTFNITTILSVNATSIDVGSGVPCVAIEEIGSNYVEIDDWGYARTSSSSSSPHSAYITIIGI